MSATFREISVTCLSDDFIRQCVRLLSLRKAHMKERFYMCKRSGVYYAEDAATGRQQSLKTKDGVEARRIVHTKNEAARCPTLNLMKACCASCFPAASFLRRSPGRIIPRFPLSFAAVAGC